MQPIVIQNATYQVQRVFVGSQPVSELIRSRVSARPQNFPLTKPAAGTYNLDERTVVRRYNGQ